MFEYRRKLCEFLAIFMKKCEIGEKCSKSKWKFFAKYWNNHRTPHQILVVGTGYNRKITMIGLILKSYDTSGYILALKALLHLKIVWKAQKTSSAKVTGNMQRAFLLTLCFVSETWARINLYRVVMLETNLIGTSQLIFTRSKSAIQRLEKDVKYIYI